MGTTVPQREPLLASLRFRVTKRLKKKVEIEAVNRETSVQDLCTEAIEKHLASSRTRESKVA